MVTVTALLAGWQLSHMLYQASIPGVLDTAYFLAREGVERVVVNTLLTLTRSFLGFTVALALALTIGVAYTLSTFVREAVRALNTLLQSVSVLVWTIVLVMVFGVLSPAPPVLVAALASLPVLLSAVVTGLEASSNRLRDLAVILGASRLAYYRDFLLPSLTPSLVAAARSAMGIALRISVVAEAFGSNGGIGYMIVNYYNLAEPRGVFAWSIILVALMVALDKLLLEPFERRLRRWSVMN